MPWVRPDHPPPVVNSSAKTLMLLIPKPAHEFEMEDWIEYSGALAVVNNWRASHGHPLNTFQTNLRRAARRIDNSAIVAQRTKRLASITDKLARQPRMKLTQMQDIGGCRAVLHSVARVRQLVHYYDKETQIKHTIASRDDYIARPQKSGYRGIHLVFRYVSDRENTKIYNGLKIEMQIRSQYQHAWATAVETVGTFVGESLKSGVGSERWLRFFALMGTAIAVRERTASVPETPANKADLVAELRELVEQLDVERRLRAYGTALKTFEENADPRDRYYLLNLNIKTEELTVKGYRFHEADAASSDYLAAEEAAKTEMNRDVVMVSVDSLSSLPRAYPNYFADTRVFLDLMNQALAGKSRRIFTGQLGFDL